MTTYYLQINDENIITDVIQFPYGNYAAFNGDIPQDVLSGAYKLENGKIVEYPELRPVPQPSEIEQLRTKTIELEQTMDSILTEILPTLLGQ